MRLLKAGKQLAYMLMGAGTRRTFRCAWLGFWTRRRITNRNLSEFYIPHSQRKNRKINQAIHHDHITSPPVVMGLNYETAALNFTLDLEKSKVVLQQQTTTRILSSMMTLYTSLIGGQ
jgi:hypothetical protein